MVQLMLFILVIILIGFVMHLYSRMDLLETAVTVLQAEKGVDLIGDIESNRRMFLQGVFDAVEHKNTVSAKCCNVDNASVFCRNGIFGRLFTIFLRK